MSEDGGAAPAASQGEATGAVNQGTEGTPDSIKGAAQEAIRRHKLKVMGKEIEVDDNELKRGYGHQRAANETMQQAKAKEKQIEQLVGLLKDPEKFFDAASKLGHNPRELAEKYLSAQLEDELMDPRDKELRDAKNRLKQIEEMDKRQQDALEQERHNQLKQKYADDYTNQFVSALKESGLPATKPMVAEMAKYISRATKMNFKMTAQEAAKLVKEDLQAVHKQLYGSAEGDTLIKLLGEDVANKVRKYDTSRLKDPNAYMRTPAGQEINKPREGRTAKRLTPSEWKAFKRSPV